MASLPRLTDASLAEIEQRSEMADKIALPWIVKAKGYTLTHQEVITLCLAACDVPALLAEVRALRQGIETPTMDIESDQRAFESVLAGYDKHVREFHVSGMGEDEEEIARMFWQAALAYARSRPATEGP